MENQVQFQENVKATFALAKQHNLRLEAEIKQIKATLEDLKKTIENFKEQQSNLKIEQSSTGNNGVANSQRQPTDDSSPTIDDNTQQSTTTTASFSELKDSLDTTFKTLTNREFSVFMALYDLDKEKNGEVTYSELSQRLNISESTVRDFINQLIRKNIPIKKDRYFNGKVSLSIREEFKHLNLYQNLLKLKANKLGQKALFDL